jgi:cell division inhibitor SulA
MRVITILILVLLILTGCSSPETTTPKPIIYITENSGEPSTKIVYEIKQEKTSHEWLKDSALERRKLSEIRAINDYEDGLARHEKVNKYKNTIRSIDGMRIIGYLEEIDNKDFDKIK